MTTRLATQDIVFAAANKLSGQGKRASNREVLHEIGVGSMSTVSALMKEWRKNAPAVVATTQPLPVGLLRELELLQRNTEKAVRAECAADLEDAHDSEQLLIQENEQLLAQVASLQTELQAAREAATTAQAQLTQLQADHTALKSELGSERTSVAELRIELTKASLRLDETLPRLLQELAECRGQLTIAHQARADAELKAAVAQERASGLEQRLTASQPS